ncbi:hypothetical protein F5B20DRAFT_397169 [Whalleya microplaca]|nr:hypothetical protein F5B20DRAFT_397169 [Whalleya microplaca]
MRIEPRVEAAERMEHRIEEMISSLSNLIKPLPPTTNPGSSNQAKMVLDRLIAKPSQLKEICDTVLDKDVCFCNRRRSYQYSYTKFGPFLFRKQVIVMSGHTTECKYAGINLSQTSRSFQLVATGLRNVVSKAIFFSMSTTTGAGGQSINPKLSYLTMVDERTSPIFRVVNLLFGLGSALSYTDRIKVVDLGIKKVLQLYQEKKADPHEINIRGQSFFHIWAELESKLDKPEGNDAYFTRQLLEADLPADIYDFNGL